MLTRTYDRHKNLHVSQFLLNKFGPDCYILPRLSIRKISTYYWSVHMYICGLYMIPAGYAETEMIVEM